MGGYSLVGADGEPYVSAVPGVFGGHRRGRLYGRLDCPSALRALARGPHYARQRVFFADESAAVAAGYRPCAVCLPARYREWRAGRSRAAGEVPMPHTEAELGSLLAQLGAAPRMVSVGHGRDAASCAAARAFAEAWEARGRDVLAVVDWPEDAASWLRAATRLTAGTPDAWVLAGAPVGVGRLVRRLRQSTDWDPARTYGFAGLATTRLVRLAGAPAVHGLRGADADGGTWEIRNGWVTHLLPA